jgi:SSS family solute:Na+ symporter
MLALSGLITFIVVFAFFVFLGFYGVSWRKGDLRRLDEWGLAGRRLGTLLVWFLMGADLYTAYTFIAVPAGVYAKGSLYFFAVPYVALTFPIAMLTMTRLWTVSKNRGYITAADFVRDRFDSRTLAILIALTGVVAELPYIALQIAGMQAVLSMMLYGAVNSKFLSEISLIVAFIILATFTFTSGLRGAALTGVLKDVLIWIGIIATLTSVLLSIHGGFSAALSSVPKSPPFTGLKGAAPAAYFTLFLGSALALYLYPHSINGSLGSEDRERLRLSTALLPIYGIGLGLLALFGVLVYAVPQALAVVKALGPNAVVPSLIYYSLPAPLAGLALVGIFVGGLVPAAIMAIAAANLLTRNVVKEFYPNMSLTLEANLAKWISAAIKFVALAFVFVVSSSLIISLQLLGGIIIIQTLPAVFLGLFTSKLEPKSTIAGWVVGMLSGIYLTLLANKFSTISSTVFNTALGPLYIAVISLGLNVLVTVVGSAIAYALGYRVKSAIREEELAKLL